MTLSTADITDRMTVGEIVRFAYESIGVLDSTRDASAADKARGRERLRLIMMELPARSKQARMLAWHNITCVANQLTPYTLPDAALDVEGMGKWIPAGQSPTSPDTEIAVQQISQQKYNSLSTRSNTGVPSMMYVHRETYPLTVYFYNWPSESGTVRIRAQRRLTAPSTDDAEVDLEEHWMTYLVARLGLELAPTKSLPMKDRMLLRGEVAELLRMAKRKSNDWKGSQMAVASRRHF